MLRLEFEQSILEMIFEVGYRQLTPATVAYYLCVPIKAAEQWLDELVRDGVLELDSDPEGRLFYVLPSSSTPPPEVLEATIKRRAARGLGSPDGVQTAPFGLRRGNPFAPIEPPVPVARRSLRPVPLDADGWLETPPAAQRADSRDRVREARRPAGDLAATVPESQWTLDSEAVPGQELAPWPDAPADAAALATTVHEAELVGEDDATELRRDSVPPTPFVPMVLSLFWPGLGQIHNGQPGKGLLLFFATTFLWLLVLGWVVHLYAVVDAGVVATQRRDAYLRRALSA